MGFRDNPIINLSIYTWRYSKGNRTNVVLYFCLFLVANTLSAFEPLIVAYLLNTIQEQGITPQNYPHLIFIVSLFVAQTISFWAFHGPARIIERKNAFLVSTAYRRYLLDGVMRLPMSWHANHHSGNTIDKIEKGNQALYQYSSNTFEIIDSLVKFITAYIALAYLNLHAIYTLFFMTIVVITLILRFDAVLVKKYRKLYKTENRVAAKIYDIISNITTVIILRIEKLASSSIYKKMMEPLGVYQESNRINETKWFFVSLCNALMLFSILGTYIYLNKEQGILIGTLYALYGYAQRINGIFFRFAYQYGDIVRRNTAVLNAQELASQFQDSKTIQPLKLEPWKELTIQNLRFSYHYKDKTLHLDNLNLSIHKAERIALIGTSGSGKTTFLKIIRDLYTPKNAQIQLDGKNLPNFQALSQHITLIPQDPELFDATIEENITMGISHPLSYVRRFTDMACFTQVVNHLPKKFNSRIHERGVNLSGGEKQRLALSRGLLAAYDKPILLLDEPTSSVDFKTELHIFQNLFKAYRQKTIIASIHRLHLLPYFDTIYFFKDGKIISQGNLGQLLKTNQEFKKIWNKQKAKTRSST
ncbi:MAG: ABC transporter ATP-binding protein [Nanoarchaeota archaeon]